MKKRSMKKWIPKATPYCENCKWHRIYSNKPYQENGYCKYIGRGDWQDDSMGLLWDGDKECEEHETEESYTRARIKNIKILSELYKYKYNKLVRNTKNSK